MMMKLFPPTNIAEKLANAQSNNNASLGGITSLLARPQSTNAFDIEQLATDKIYHLDTIRDICIDYRLRFLDLKYFKNDLPQEAFDKIAALEMEHDTTLTGFKVMAPSKLFRLKNTDDPLLFVPLGNDYFYLIHKWGKDLQPMRKLRMWPFKSIANLIVFTLLISGVATYVLPMGLFSKTNDWTSIWMVYFFMFKAIASIILYGGFAMGKNFNPAIWDSKYNKS